MVIDGAVSVVIDNNAETGRQATHPIRGNEIRGRDVTE